MTADRTLLESLVGEIVPNADAVAHLGTGGFACTFKVTQDGDVFALKIIDPGVSDAERVDRELKAMQRVDHEGVVRFRAFGVHHRDGVDYRWITMDFVDGHTLGASLAGAQVFTALEAVELLRGLVRGASAIWSEGTAHRDLSPGNIMLTADGAPVIVDLGLARHVDDGTLTVLPTPGTPGWMSPEQVGSTPTHGDWRSDQFVLGAIGYLLLTGVAPFYAPSLMDCWIAPAQQTPQNIRAIDPNIPNAVADVIEKMIQKQPHRRYLQASALLADLDQAAEALRGASASVDRNPQFFVNLGFKKNWAEGEFLSALRPAGTIIDLQAGGRVAEFADAARAGSSLVISDPVTSYARSLLEFRPAGYKRLSYGEAPRLTGFADDVARVEWCRPVWEASLGDGPDIAIAPYFYAGEGDLTWIRESLACAKVFADFAATAGEDAPRVWTTVLVHANWLADEGARDRLLTELTGQPVQALYVLVHTNQVSFGPLADPAVLRGFRDLFGVMREAGVPVVVGKRASSGILLLALGADGWSSGVAANQMNSAPHPESDSDGGPAQDRVYVPKLLNLITLPTFVLMLQTDPTLVDLGTEEFATLVANNPELESLSTADRVLLLQHNLMAQRAQVQELSAMPAGQRISLLRTWITSSQLAYRSLPPTRVESEGPAFLTAWAEALR